jgi:guanosine-3',5'-bis(diphosphate) 3'-pyrophosphohydrolase
MTGAQTVESTVVFVRQVFAGKVDKGGKPYADHCIRVMMRLPPETPNDERMAALLHDVVEDTHITLADLRLQGWSERTVTLVEKLTRFPGAGTYMDYVRGIATSGDPGLIVIKLADNADNCAPDRLASLPAEKRQSLLQRYAHARRALEDAPRRKGAPL